MNKISKREIDVEKLAENLKFKKYKKKKLEYEFVNFDDLEPLTYSKSEKERKIETITSDGKETTNTASKEDFIFCGPTGEKYVLKQPKVKKMYTGKIKETLTPEQSPRLVAKYNDKEAMFKASWGENTIIKPGDYLLKEQDGSGYYRVAKKEFELTYDLC
jgi:hypothetical protein